MRATPTKAVKRLTFVMPAGVAVLSLRDRIRAGELINFLIVRVGRERFALELASVQEAVDARNVDRVPQLPANAVGLLQWRDAAHTLWSPRGVLRTELDYPDTALFLRANPAPVAVAVDDVEDLITISGDAVGPLPGVDDAGGLVVGVLHVGDSLATVLDAPVFAAALRGAVPVVSAET
jgi:chemotaxis signal transduction protein